MHILILLLIVFLSSWASLPEEYRLLIKYRQSSDPSIAYRILRKYPDAVFRDDLMLLLAREEHLRNRSAQARKLLEDLNPANLTEGLKGTYVNLWKELELDPKAGFLKSPVLFREFIPGIKLSEDEALRVSEGLYKRRYYRELITLLEPLNSQKTCYFLGMSYRALKERDRALEILKGCEDSRAKAELALIYYELGDRERVEQSLLGIDDKELLSETFYKLGRRSIYAGRHVEALDYFWRMQASHRREFHLGLVYYITGDYSKACELFQRSAEYGKNGEEKSAGYFWAYKSCLFIDKKRADEYMIKASNGAGFYHAVASVKLGLPIASRALRVVMEDEALPRVARMIRAIWLAGFPEYAKLEAYKRIEELSSSDILSLSSLDPHLAIRLAVKKYGYGSYVYNAVAFPRPYRDLVEKASKKYIVEPALIYAVMRQESLFDPNAVSVANARGLMQLIDSTAQYVAKKEGIKLGNIYDPETNILLGTAYLREMLDQWKGNLVQTLASYNAGPTRVKNWQQREDSYLFIETIPLPETRDYVKKVLYNYYVYSELLK